MPQIATPGYLIVNPPHFPQHPCSRPTDVSSALPPRKPSTLSLAKRRLPTEPRDNDTTNKPISGNDPTPSLLCSSIPLWSPPARQLSNQLGSYPFTNAHQPRLVYHTRLEVQERGSLRHGALAPTIRLPRGTTPAHNSRHVATTANACQGACERNQLHTCDARPRPTVKHQRYADPGRARAEVSLHAAVVAGCPQKRSRPRQCMRPLAKTRS